MYFIVPCNTVSYFILHFTHKEILTEGREVEMEIWFQFWLVQQFKFISSFIFECQT